MPWPGGGGGGTGADPTALKIANNLTDVANAALARAAIGAGVGDGDLVAANGLAEIAALGAGAQATARGSLALGALATGDDASDVPMARIAGSTYSTAQDMQTVFHSTGRATGGAITDNGDGTCGVAAGTGSIRAANSSTSLLLFFDWAAANPVALVDGSVNYLYAQYNGGAPQVVADTVARHLTDAQTNVLLGSVLRDGTTLHISQSYRVTVGDHASLMERRLLDTVPIQRAVGGGAVISETGTRNIAITAGRFWVGYEPATTAAVDTSAAGTIAPYYRDGGGGWTAAAPAATIDNTSYDNGSGVLAGLTGLKFGVRWIFIEIDGALFYVYGRVAHATLAAAQEEALPADLPPQFPTHAILAGRVIVQNGVDAYADIDSAFSSVYATTAVTAHGDLTGLDYASSGHTGFQQTTAVDVAQGAHGFAVNDFIYRTAAGAYAKAKADSGTTAEVVGWVTAVADAGNFTYQPMPGSILTALTDDAAAVLVVGSAYYLSSGSAGKITATEPTGTNVSKPVAIALTTSTAVFVQMRGATGASSAGRYTPPGASILTDWDVHYGASIGGVPCVDGNDIDLVTDQSTSGIDATQAVAGSRPQFRAGALNGYAVADFSTSDFMTFGTALGRPANYSIYLVIRPRTTVSQYVCGSVNAGLGVALSWGLVNLNTVASKVQAWFGDDTLSSKSTNTYVEIGSLAWMVVAITHADGDDHTKIYIDGRQPALTKTTSAAISSAGVAQNFSMGRAGDYTTSPFDGYGARKITYSAAHSASTVRTITNGLMAMYGLVS